MGGSLFKERTSSGGPGGSRTLSVFAAVLQRGVRVSMVVLKHRPEYEIWPRATASVHINPLISTGLAVNWQSKVASDRGGFVGRRDVSPPSRVDVGSAVNWLSRP